MSIVTFEPLGRLANLIFQASACIGYAKKYGTDWALPRHYHHREIYKYWPTLPTFKGNPRKLKVYDVATDEDWGYKEIPNQNGDVKLRGFFQSEKFFENAKDEVRNAFKLDIRPVMYVSIHVRRGDYLDENQSTFRPVDMNYLNQAIGYFKNLGKTQFAVFSDDIAWCKQNLTDKDCEFVFSEGRNEFKDLSLMASCSDHIISNSSFSWMSAWLCPRSNKIVVSPHHEAPNWFLHNRMDTTHLIPDGWVQIKYR